MSFEPSILISSAATLFAGLSSYISWAIQIIRKKKIDKFRDYLGNNLKALKHTILTMDSNFDDKNKILFIETIHDLTLYQTNEKEKERFLTKQENFLLSELQENIEDCIGNIFAATDLEINKQIAIAAIKKFLKEL